MRKRLEKGLNVFDFLKKYWIVLSVLVGVSLLVIFIILKFNQSDLEVVEKSEERSFEELNSNTSEILGVHASEEDIIVDVIVYDSFEYESVIEFSEEILEIYETQKNGEDEGLGEGQHEFDTLVIHLFDDKDGYNSIRSKGYPQKSPLIEKWEYPLNTSNAQLLVEISQEVNKDEANLDALTYDILEAEMEGSNLFVHLLVEGDQEKISEFVPEMESALLTLNKEVEELNLHLYESELEYTNEQPSFLYRDDTLIKSEVIEFNK